MKKRITFSLMILWILSCFVSIGTANASPATSQQGPVVLSEANFPDATFRAYISNLTGVAEGGTISEGKLLSVKYIDVRGSSNARGNITDLKGIEYFTSLNRLYCGYNQLTSLDVSNNTALTYLNCSENEISNLNVSNTGLKELDCSVNRLTSLDVSKNTALTRLICSGNQLTSLDLSKNTALTSLDCRSIGLTSLDVSMNTELTSLDCYNNQLTSLDVSNNTALTYLSCSNNQLTSLDVSKNTTLTSLNCHHNQLTSLDVSNNTALTRLECYNNQLTSLDLSKNTALEYLYCQSNQLMYLDLSKCTKLRGENYTKTNQYFPLTATATGSNQYSIPIPSGFDISKVSGYKVNGVSITPSTIAGELVFTANDLNQLEDVIIAEIDWTKQSAYYDGVWYDNYYATLSFDNGLVIESAPPSGANYWEPQAPIIAHIPLLNGGGQYQVKFTLDAPAAGEIQLALCSWDGSGATKDAIFNVQAGEHEYAIDFPDYPQDATDAMLFYECGKIPGRHIIKKVQVLDVDASAAPSITYLYDSGNSVAGSMDVRVNITSVEEPNYDNTIYMDDTEVLSGTEAVLSVKMKNTVVAEGFEFNLYLPEGITVVTDEDGFPEVTLSTERTTSRKTNSFDAVLRADGSLRVLGASTNGSTISGNDGEIVQVKVAIADDMEEGEYIACVKDIAISDENSVSYTSAMTTSSIKVNAYIVGDANKDRAVDVADFTAVAHHLLENTPANFHPKAADANQDERLDVADLTAIAHLILYGTISKPTNALPAKQFMPMAVQGSNESTEENYIYIEPISVRGQSQVTLSIKMKNTVEMEGFGFDLYLPEGMSFATDADGFAEVSLSTERTNSKKTNSFDSVIQEDGSLRVLAASTNGSSISGNDGEVALVTVNIASGMEVDEYPLIMKEIAISDVDAVSHRTDLQESTITILNIGITTDINGMDNLDDDAEWYTLDGKKLNGKPKAKGVYIMNRKKVRVK